MRCELSRVRRVQAPTLRRAADLALDAAGSVADHWPALATWRTERFCAQVARRVPGLAVDAAHGTRYFIRPQDSAIGAAIVRFGAFDADKITAVLGLLQAHGISITRLLDVGANIGTTTIEILRQLPDVSCVAFEPDPTNFQLLLMNLVANGLDGRVQTYRAAVGDASGTLTLELANSNFGDHRIRLAGVAANGDYDEASRTTVSVPSLRLDDVDNLGVDKDTLVFVDTQGFEGHVLAGARRTLSCQPPLVVELWPYGLDRVNGRQLLFDELARREHLYDINESPPRLVAPHELEALATQLRQRSADSVPDHTDLLAL